MSELRPGTIGLAHCVQRGFPIRRRGSIIFGKNAIGIARLDEPDPVIGLIKGTLPAPVVATRFLLFHIGQNRTKPFRRAQRTPTIGTGEGGQNLV